MLTRLLWRRDRAPSWLEKVFWRLTGSKEEFVEVDAREAGCSIVATDMSPVLLRCEPELRCDFERSFADDTRLGTSERREELIYSYAPGGTVATTAERKPRGFVTLVAFQNGLQRGTMFHPANFTKQAESKVSV